MNECLVVSNNLQKCINVLARVLQAQISKKREDVNNPVSVKMLVMVRNLIDVTAAMEVTPHVETKLQSLAPFVKDGKWVTQGRMKHGLLAILGVAQLQVLLPNQRLAELVSQRAR